MIEKSDAMAVKGHLMVEFYHSAYVYGKII
jgi:hypothetical protein